MSILLKTFGKLFKEKKSVEVESSIAQIHYTQCG